MGSGPIRCDPRLDQRERTSEPFGKASVGFGSVADHEHRVGLDAEEISDEIGHRLFGFAGEDRLDSADRGDRRHDRPAAGFESARSRIRGVAVRADQARSVEHCPTRDSQTVVVEVAMEPDHHGVDRLVEVGAGVRHHHRSTGSHGFGDAGPTGDEHALARFEQERRGHRRRHDVACGLDPDLREGGLVLGASGRRVVRDEQHPSAGGSDRTDRLDGPRDRLMRQPDDAIEVTQHMGDPTWHPVMVPRFTPFPALRYCDHRIDDLVAPPYDVLSDADLDELNARDRFNITHVDVPRESDGPGRYERAGETLRQWIDAGVMAFDDQATFTLYRLRFTDASGARRSIVGVLGGLEVGPYGECGVLPHERITPKASTDRLDLTRATRANMSPIWGLSLADGLTELLTDPGEPIASVVIDGVEHIVERVTDPARIAAISAKIATDDVLIADGHHRYGVAQKFRDEVREATGSDATDAEDTLVFVSELVEDQLSVEAIHRLYADVHVDDLAVALDEGFDRSPAGTPSAATLAEMDERGVLCLVRPDGSAEWLAPKPGVFDGIRALDGLWLEELLSGVEHSVTYQHGVDRVVEAVAGGDAHAAVLIRPVSVAEIERTAREGVVMPPKSTFFTPKLLTGLVIRPLA